MQQFPDPVAEFVAGLRSGEKGRNEKGEKDRGGEESKEMKGVPR